MSFNACSCHKGSSTLQNLETFCIILDLSRAQKYRARANTRHNMSAPLCQNDIRRLEFEASCVRTYGHVDLELIREHLMGGRFTSHFRGLCWRLVFGSISTEVHVSEPLVVTNALSTLIGRGSCALNVKRIKHCYTDTQTLSNRYQLSM
jgi:hypothetical protein